MSDQLNPTNDAFEEMLTNSRPKPLEAPWTIETGAWRLDAKVEKEDALNLMMDIRFGENRHLLRR